MDGVERGRGLWRNVKQRLGLKGIGLCGSTWSLGQDDAIEEEQVGEGADQIPATRGSSGMNLAAALAAERNPRSSGPTSGAGPAPVRSLMGLFKETDGEDRKRDKGGGGSDVACCVCMERNKGAAFIPCGHTYCRVCSRELWSNRGSCPLCNRTITGVLDIF